MNDFLWKEFSGACKLLSKTDTTPADEEIFEYLVYAYNDPRRFYHNLHHVALCIATTHSISCDEVTRAKVKLALFYHDVVYNPISKSNEYHSAWIAADHLKYVCVPPDDVGWIASAIRLTARHAEQVVTPIPEGMEYVLDVDLVGLATSWETYTKNSDNIVKEYEAVYSLMEIYEGRSKFLTSMILKPRIYLSEYFKPLEAKAIENMKKELAIINTLKVWQEGR